MKKLLIIIIIAINSCLFTELGAKTGNSPDSALTETEYINLKKNLVYFELLGNGITGSINFERTLKNWGNFHQSIRVGVEPIPKHNLNSLQLITILESKIFYGIKKHYFVIGFGVDHLFFRFTNPRIVLASWRIGYRFQNPNNNFFFNVGFTPFTLGVIANWESERRDAEERGELFPHDKYKSYLPWLGIGFGISF